MQTKATQREIDRPRIPLLQIQRKLNCNGRFHAGHVLDRESAKLFPEALLTDRRQLIAHCFSPFSSHFNDRFGWINSICFRSDRDNLHSVQCRIGSIVRHDNRRASLPNFSTEAGFEVDPINVSSLNRHRRSILRPTLPLRLRAPDRPPSGGTRPATMLALFVSAPRRGCERLRRSRPAR